MVLGFENTALLITVKQFNPSVLLYSPLQLHLHVHLHLHLHVHLHTFTPSHLHTYTYTYTFTPTPLHSYTFSYFIKFPAETEETIWLYWWCKLIWFVVEVTWFLMKWFPILQEMSVAACRIYNKGDSLQHGCSHFTFFLFFQFKLVTVSPKV